MKFITVPFSPWKKFAARSPKAKVKVILAISDVIVFWALGSMRALQDGLVDPDWQADLAILFPL